MKREKTWGVVSAAGLAGVLVLAALLGCQAPNGSGTNDPGTPPGGDKAIEVADANGAFIGYCTQSTSSALLVFTTRGFFVPFTWAGTIIEADVLFTLPHGAGTPFIKVLKAVAVYGYASFMMGNPYVLGDVDSSGIGIPDPGITNLQSFFSGGTITEFSGQGVYSYESCLRLRQSSRAEIGIPDIIAGPLALRFK